MKRENCSEAEFVTDAADEEQLVLLTGERVNEALDEPYETQDPDNEPQHAEETEAHQRQYCSRVYQSLAYAIAMYSTNTTMA